MPITFVIGSHGYKRATFLQEANALSKQANGIVDMLDDMVHYDCVELPLAIASFIQGTKMYSHIVNLASPCSGLRVHFLASNVPP